MPLKENALMTFRLLERGENLFENVIKWPHPAYFVLYNNKISNNNSIFLNIIVSIDVSM